MIKRILICLTLICASSIMFLPFVQAQMATAQGHNRRRFDGYKIEYVMVDTAHSVVCYKDNYASASTPISCVFIPPTYHLLPRPK